VAEQVERGGENDIVALLGHEGAVLGLGIKREMRNGNMKRCPKGRELGDDLQGSFWKKLTIKKR